MSLTVSDLEIYYYQKGYCLLVYFYLRDKAWAEDKKMGAYLSVAKGSSEPPKFVEVHYKGGKDGEAPLVFVGKGITFDR